MKLTYLCPICTEELKLNDSSFVCKNNHVFDVAKEGYVNLASVKKTNTAVSGDSREMCRDRRLFLEQGYYEPLARLMADTIISLKKNDNVSIIDAGCGEGYYLRTISKLLTENVVCAGVDLSKEAVRLASKSEKSKPENERISFAVAGVFDMPFSDGCADFVISVFAPIADKENLRLLKKGGYMLVACPSEKHLFGLKERIYETARENEEKVPEYNGFELADIKHICYDIHVEKEYIPALFGMTPYYWKSSVQTQKAVNDLNELDTPCDFMLKIYRKI